MSNKKKYMVLLVDDEQPFHDLMRDCDEFADDYIFRHVYSADKMWKWLGEEANYDLIILDLRLNGDEENVGFDLIPQLLEKYPNIPVVIATKDQEQDAVIEAMDRGAKSFLQKWKFNPTRWEKKFREVIETAQIPKLKQEVAQLKVEKKAIDSERYPFIGQSPLMMEVKKSLKQAAIDPKLTVLLTGETGVGKEIAVRYMHRNGPRYDKPFVGINLSAIPRELLESNLFGHVKGSFTGALKDTKGFFEQAHGGILLMDEIGDISHDIQVKLLRVLEDRTYQRVGDDKQIRMDVQIILATHRNLAQEVEKGNFRRDLYERIRTISIEIPPLRNHPDDIMPILEHYLSFHIPHTRPVEILTGEVMQRLLVYSWPGNVRELKNAVEYMVYRKNYLEKDRIDWHCLPEDVRENRPLFPPSEPGVKPVPVKPGRLVVLSKNRKEEQASTDLTDIEEALRQFYGNKTKVSEFLGYKGTDHLRARILTCFKNFPHLVEQFPLLTEHYGTLVK